MAGLGFFHLDLAKDFILYFAFIIWCLRFIKYLVIFMKALMLCIIYHYNYYIKTEYWNWKNS